MHIVQWPVANTIVLELHGALAAPIAPKFLRATVRRITRTGGPCDLVLDLEDVPSIDAAGLGALLVAYGVMARSGRTLKLARVAGHVHGLLVVCRLTTVFETFESVAAAVANGAGGTPNQQGIQPCSPPLSRASLEVIQHFLQQA